MFGSIKKNVYRPPTEVDTRCIDLTLDSMPADPGDTVLDELRLLSREKDNALLFRP